MAILELLATATKAKLNEHFEQVLRYAQQLNPLEVWVVHFSRADKVVEKPHWPCEKLQQKGLNVVHFWHNKEFTNVRMSARCIDKFGVVSDVINQRIIPLPRI